MPNYKYEHLTERGGCGQTWVDYKPIHARDQGVMCPYCMAQIEDKTWHNPQTGLLESTIIRRMPLVQVIHDIDHQDGRMGDPVEMPSLGHGERVRSRRELEDKKKRIREELYDQTHGKKEIMRPFPKDPDDPKAGVVWEKVTTVREGWDIGELHPQEGEAPERANRPKNPWRDLTPGETMEEAEALLNKKIEDADKIELTPKRRGRPKGAKDKKPRKRRGSGGTQKAQPEARSGEGQGSPGSQGS